MSEVTYGRLDEILRSLGFSVLVCWILLLQVSAASAGMPAPLPVVTEKVLRLNDSAMARLQTISFFLLGLLLCAAAVRGLWNYLQRDFPILPRLSFGKALVGVLLWGMLFVLVLTMISGARELMTPGAWRKQGFTYKLVQEPAASETPSPQDLRRLHLEQLRTTLWQFAATHNGRFPGSDEIGAVPHDRWEIPETGGIRYLYAPGLSAGHTASLLVWEPEIDSGERLVLKTNGDILPMRSADIQKRPETGGPAMKKVVIILVACLIVLGISLSWEAPVAVVFGWIPFLIHVLPRVTVDWPSVVLGCVSLGLFAVGVHWLGQSWRGRHLSTQPEEQTPSRWKIRWSLALVVVVCLLFMAGISVVGIAHQVTWLATSDHLVEEALAHPEFSSDTNLRYIGLGILSYAPANGNRLPPGASFTSDGTMLHSWQTHMLPYMGYSTSGIDFKHPWNDPVNEKYFKSVIRQFINPGFRTSELVDGDGFGLSHYAANSRILGGNKERMLQDFAGNEANTMLIGEVNSHYKAWGQPGNWRDPMRGINRSPHGFGGPAGAGGVNFLMADGSVRFVSDRISPEGLRALSNRPEKSVRQPDE